MKTWIKRLIFLILIVVIIFLLFFNKPEEIVNYRTATVSKGNIETIVSGQGTLVAKSERKEYSKVSSEVAEIYYIEGDNVEVGYPIIKLDSSAIDVKIKAQEIAIKQANLSKQNIENQIKNLKIVAENDGYVSNLTIAKGSYVTNTMAICNVIKDSKFEVVLEFTYYENNPIIVGGLANVTMTDSFSTLTGKVTKVSDMRKLITGNAQVIDVTIEVETTGYSLEGAVAKAEISNGATIIQSVNAGTFKSVNSNIIRAKTNGTVSEVLVNEGTRIKKGDVIATLTNSDLETNLQNINLNIENLNDQLELMQDQLDDYLISAQIKGIITKQDAKVGDVIPTGTLLTTIANKDTMEFKIPIDELDIAKIDYEHEVRVVVDAIPETEENPLIGKIIYIPHEGTTMAGVTDYYVTIEVTGNSKMKISMNANADIVVQSVKDVLVIPIDSVIKENGKRYVDILLSDGTTVERKEIITGASDITNIEVIEGLNEGENVIIPEIISGISFF